jgi:hypothetical protein
MSFDTLDVTLIRWTCFGEGKAFSMFAGPVINLLNISNLFGWLIAVALYAGIAMLLYYEAPVSWYNSIDGYINLGVVLLYSFLVYYFISFVIIAILHDTMCASKKKLRARYRPDRIPGWLREDL